MYKLLLLLGFILFNITTQNSIKINITGFSNNNGQAIIKLYNSKTDFLKKASLVQKIKIQNGKASYEIKNIQKGYYTI